MPLQRIRAKDVDWKSVGTRLHGYRLIKGWDEATAALKWQIKIGTIRLLERGYFYRSVNSLWSIIRAEGISVDWLFNGKGDYFSDDPIHLLPETITRDRGAGIRRDDFRIEAEEGSFSGEPLEFVMAVDAYKRHNNKPFPTLTELFELLVGLGYRKVAIPTIRPATGEH